MNALEIAREASQLPHEQLSELVDRLLELMDGPRGSKIDQASLLEAEQRLARFDLGTELTVTSSKRLIFIGRVIRRRLRFTRAGDPRSSS